MKKIVMSRVLLLLLTIGWMTMIFGFSAQTGEESGDLSAIISEPITAVLVALDGDVTAAEQQTLYFQVDGIVRMGAHFAEYAVLGVLLCLFQQSFGSGRFVIAWLIGVGYAVADEIHQAFTPDRMCDPVDVLIDASGLLLGAVCIHYLTKIWRKKHVHNP